MAKKGRNYKKEAEWASSPEQIARRVARNRARRKAIREGKVRKGDGKELDHVGSHPRGSLDKVPVRVTSRTFNRKRQPAHKGKNIKR